MSVKYTIKTGSPLLLMAVPLRSVSSQTGGSVVEDLGIAAVEWDLCRTEKRVGLETNDTPTGSP